MNRLTRKSISRQMSIRRCRMRSEETRGCSSPCWISCFLPCRRSLYRMWVVVRSLICFIQFTFLSILNHFLEHALTPVMRAHFLAQSSWRTVGQLCLWNSASTPWSTNCTRAFCFVVRWFSVCCVGFGKAGSKEFTIHKFLPMENPYNSRLMVFWCRPWNVAAVLRVGCGFHRLQWQEVGGVLSFWEGHWQDYSRFRRGWGCHRWPIL